MLQMTKEQSVRFTIAIHTVGQQYVLEWLSLANIKQTKWSGFFVEGIRNNQNTTTKSDSCCVNGKTEPLSSLCFLDPKTSKIFLACVCAHI